MSRASLTSGDVIADRRYEYARAYAAADDFAAALDLYAQVRELTPEWLPAMLGEADCLIELGRGEEAAPILARMVELDPDGLFGAELKLAALGLAAAPAAPPTAYVKGLFDSYADKFDKALVGDLGYRTPWHLADRLALLDPKRTYGSVLDLGCGTGLMAEALGDLASGLVGCDLSPGMLAKARVRGRYQRLIEADVVAALDGEAGPFDLITAADVFVYVGRLEATFAGVVKRLAPGGLFAFSVEAAEEGDGVQLRDSLRYAHGEGYVRALAAAAGLDIRVFDTAPLRLDRGKAIKGYLVLARHGNKAANP
ncbi:class I SAM-dependent DNA methyltransferase [Oryzibacter oryziterrae]|uniref:class I SAM-dependent DNA methyltransferase n=1 Tax=Oryzibacter oryziterrae TaxID=2766474 RepID=UPI001F0256F7|nr:methyltransferase [Oryzibacter oryziterrae]